jgi:hypothetical protein
MALFAEKLDRLWLFLGGTVVKHPTHNLKFKGLNPASDTGGLYDKSNYGCN